MYVVAGVTGRTGSVVAESLLEQKKPITVVVRTAEKGESWRAKGAEVAVGSLEDTGTLTRILENAEGVYLLIPPNPAAQDFLGAGRRVADALAKAVSDSGVPHVVFLSSVGAQLESGTGPIRILQYAESILAPLAKDLTLLRPTYFLENWQAALGVAEHSGIFPSFLTANRKMPMIATKDIGRFAAESLLSPARGRRVIELAGPENYSPEDIAAIVASLLNRDVRLQTLPPSAAVATFTRFGFSESAAKGFEEMYTGINSGQIDFERSGAEFREGTVNAADVLRGLLSESGRAQAGSA